MGAMTWRENRQLPSGDNANFSRFYEAELAPQVRRARLILGTSDAANDVVHDCFVELYRRWDSVEDPGPYLQRMVLNGCRDHLRRNSHLLGLLPKLGDGVPRDETAEILWDVLADLPFQQRAAIVLRFYEGMTEAGIAETLDCPTGSVGPWITRALATMRKALS